MDEMAFTVNGKTARVMTIVVLSYSETWLVTYVKNSYVSGDSSNATETFFFGTNFAISQMIVGKKVILIIRRFYAHKCMLYSHFHFIN